MHKLPSLPQDLFFGPEIELMWPQEHGSYPSWLPSTWRSSGDGSIVASQGFQDRELTPRNPLKGQKGMSEYKSLLQLLRSNGAKVNSTCGCHVHLSYNIYIKPGLETFLRNLITGLVRVEKGIYAYNGKELRERGRYARPVAEAYDDYYSRGSHPDDKYYGLNLFSLDRLGSLEFRYFAGTLNPQIVELNVNLAHQLCQKASQGVEFPDLRGAEYETAAATMFQWLYGTLDIREVQTAMKMVVKDVSIDEPSSPIPGIHRILCGLWS